MSLSVTRIRYVIATCITSHLRACERWENLYRRAVQLLVVSWWQRRATFLHTLPAGWRNEHQFATCADWARPREIEQPERGHRSGWTQVLWPFDDFTPPLLSLAPYRRTESNLVLWRQIWHANLATPWVKGSRNQARPKAGKKHRMEVTRSCSGSGQTDLEVQSLASHARLELGCEPLVTVITCLPDTPRAL